jgi:hypothetical protein
MKNYIRNIYEEDLDFDSQNQDLSPKRVEKNYSNTENDYSHFYKRSNNSNKIKNLQKMKMLLAKMGEKLNKPTNKESLESEDYSKYQLHQMLTNIVNQLLGEQSRVQSNFKSSLMNKGDTYKTFIELESDKFESENSIIRKNPRGYHGFFHEDIIKSIVKLEEMIESRDKGSFGEMGIIDRNGRLINENLSEMTEKENITSILADSYSRVKGLTGQMDFNKPYNQKSVNDFDSVSGQSLSKAQKQLDNLLYKHMRDQENEDKNSEKQKQQIKEWEEKIKKQTSNENQKISRTVNLNNIDSSLSKFKKKRMSQRYVLNSESELSRKPVTDSLEELQKKVFTFDNNSKKINKQLKKKYFDFTKMEASRNSNPENKTKNIEIPSIMSKNSSFYQDSVKESFQSKAEDQKSIDEVINIRKIKSIESQKSFSKKNEEISNICKQESKNNIQMKIYPESGSASKKGIGANWSAVNNITNISLRVLDSRQNMSMIHNINFSKMVDSKSNQPVPFNSKGASLNNSRRKVKLKDIFNPKSNFLILDRRSIISESSEKRSLFNPMKNLSTKLESSRTRRIKNLKDQKNKQNFMQELLKKAGKVTGVD